ncbi:pro-resilin-like [Daphnia carinata]|uniref:pro-resilin-like n=1 Tax=Daphnia carinata TaxID=120202 RepID=UPI00257BB01E|nr:pro-resilin-like [Daphnia carinata]
MNKLIILTVLMAIAAALPVPQSNYATTPYKANEYPPQPYSFSWSVLDKPSFQEYSHTQSSDGKVTTGNYRVYLPDGRVQTVTYTADENGYRADVKYETFSKTGAWIPSAIGFRVASRT